MNVLHATAGVAGFGFVVLAEELVPRRIAREVRVLQVQKTGVKIQELQRLKTVCKRRNASGLFEKQCQFSKRRIT